MLSHLQFKEYSTLNGLPNNDVQTLFQDSNGFVWVGTKYGLFRYDGYGIQEIKSNLHNPSLLTSNNIQCITEDKLNRLWIGTDNGFNVFNKKTRAIEKIIIPKASAGKVQISEYLGLQAASNDNAVIDRVLLDRPRWTAIRALRADVQKEIEAVRAAGQVGSSLQAEVEIRAAGDNFELLTSLGDDLRFVLICSKATVVQVASDADAGIVVTPSAHKKCERCWHYREDVGQDAAHPTICGRCTSNLHGTGENRVCA